MLKNKDHRKVKLNNIHNSQNRSLFLNINLFILAVLDRHCCVWAFSSCVEWGLLFVVVRGLLIAVASLVAEHRL